MTTALEVTTGEPALEDEGIPGGPGVYSTRCPPLPRLRMRESRDIVHRAVLRAKGIDPDLVPSPSSSSAASKPADRADGPSHLPAIALAASDPTPLDRSEIESLLPKSRRAGGARGRFRAAAARSPSSRRAEVAAVRRERRRVLRDAARDLEDARFSPRANAIGHGRGGTGPAATIRIPTSVVWRCTPRSTARFARRRIRTVVFAFARGGAHRRRRGRARRREDRRAGPPSGGCRARGSSPGGRGQRRARARRRLESDLKARRRSRSPRRRIRARANRRRLARLRARPLPRRARRASRRGARGGGTRSGVRAIADRLREGARAAVTGVETVKATLADAEADVAACRAYGEEAETARVRAAEALGWIKARYLERANGWKRNVDAAKAGRDASAERLRDARAADRARRNRLERERAAREKRQNTMRDVTHATREAVAEREAAESRCRAALARLATAVRLDKPETRAPEDIVDALRESRARREDTAAKISRLQRREQDTWRRLAAEKAALRTARLGLASARGRDARRSERTSRGGFFVETALGSSDEDAVFAGSGTVGADADERITRESEMEDTLAAAEKTLGASFRRFRAAMERLATLDEGLRKIDDMSTGSRDRGLDRRVGGRSRWTTRRRGGSSDAAARSDAACAVGDDPRRRVENPESEIRIRDRTAVSAVSDGEASVFARRRIVAESVESDDELDDELDVDARELAALDERGSERGSALAPPSRGVVSVALLRFLSPPPASRVEFRRRRGASSVRVPSQPARLDATLVDSSTSSAKVPSSSPRASFRRARRSFRGKRRARGFRGPPAGGSQARLGRVAAFAGRWTTIPRA